MTGAAGQIGRQLIGELSVRHELRLIVRVPVPQRKSVVADIARNHSVFGEPHGDFGASLGSLRSRADVVIHLAADVRNYASWECVLRDNIQVTWNVIQAAVKYRVPRVVFTSSIGQ